MRSHLLLEARGCGLGDPGGGHWMGGPPGPLSLAFSSSETIMFLHQIFYQGLKARISSWPTLVLGESPPRPAPARSGPPTPPGGDVPSGDR